MTDDEEMIAAAWLHDVVEDTPATLYDVEKEFGTGVAELVENLTDISKPGDGNRLTRKSIDKKHIARASQRAKTIKLADLIDNASDISKHETMAIMGLESRRSAKKVIREMESLRNNLAHAQDIVTYDWGQIVRLAGRLEEASKRKD